MNFLHKALKAINEIPKPVKTFASKALVLLIVWQVVYLGFLAPSRVIDKPLSMFTGNATAWCVKKLMPGHSIVVKEVLQNSYMINLPDWYINGLATYAGYGWSSEMDDFIRETFANKKLKNMYYQNSVIAEQEARHR